jgi:hypothetical protein
MKVLKYVVVIGHIHPFVTRVKHDNYIGPSYVLLEDTALLLLVLHISHVVAMVTTRI